MPLTKVPILSYNFPNAGSWPLSAADWTRIGVGGAQISTWNAANDIKLNQVVAIPHNDWYRANAAQAFQQVYASIKVINDNNNHGEIDLALLCPVAQTTFAVGNDTGYFFTTDLAGNWNIRRAGVIVANSPPLIPAINIGDVIELWVVQTGPTQVTVSAIVNGATVASYVDNAPIVPGARTFAWGFETHNNPSFLDIGSLEFGQLANLNTFAVIPGILHPLPYIKRR